MKNKIEKYKSNQKLDLQKVIDEYSSYVRTIINNMASEYLSKEDVEEIVSDTFFILWKNRNSEIKYLDSYIAGIAKNLIKEKFKKCNITYNIEDYENNIGYFDELEMFSEEREKINNLEIGYKALNEMELKLISLFYYSSKSIKEIAKELKMSETNVKTKLFRIRKKLKKFLM